jgi:cyclopropane-fatty-acyl-phospholipid synthase
VSAAEILRPLVGATLGDDATVRVRCWDGSGYGPPDAPVRVVFRSRRALRRLLWAPNELGFARAYVSGDVDLEGDVFTGLAELERLADPARGPGIVVDGRTRAAVVGAALRLGVVGPPPRPPAEEARLAGRRHTRGRDSRAVTHHYDVGNDFYELVLGPSLIYSCAYFPDGPAGPPTVEAAQLAKCDLVARKLGLTRDTRVLDVGCGWGTFAIHAARTYGARVVGVTLSPAQAASARRRAREAGVGDRVEIRVQDYRDVTDGPFDAIASIGMAEHVGLRSLPDYGRHLHSLLRPRGRLLNHAIARRPGPPDEPSRTSFIERYVFPDGELEPLGTMVAALEDAGLEVRDVESLREHYALTLRAWVGNLERRWDEAVALTSPGRARVWRLYMAGSALAFEANRLGVNQVLAVRPDDRGASGVPRTRWELLGG